MSTAALAAQVLFEPSLTLKETYTDNVNLRRGSEGDWITEVNPGLVLQVDGNRLNANVGYTLQNRFYAKDSDRNTLSHNLRADALAVLMKDFAFLNLKTRRSQQLLSTDGGVPLDNLNTANRTDISALSVNPYFKKRFGGKAEGSASYFYETLTYSEGASDAEIEAVTVGLGSGPSFQRLFWSLDYSQKTTKREEAGDDSRESFSVETSYQLNQNLSALFRAGKEDNDLATAQNREGQNGSYYAGGISLIPHSTLRIDLLSGVRLDQASIFWAPTRRSVVNISRRNQKVGLNPGNVWQGSMKLVNRRITWSASYLKKITSVQELQSLGADSSQGTQVGIQPASDDLSSLEAPPPPVEVPPPPDGFFLRKRLQTNFGYRAAKSLITASLYRERRVSENDNLQSSGGNNNLQSSGGSVSWSWRFATRTIMLLRFQGFNSEPLDDAGERTAGRFRSTSINFSRKMGRKLEGTVVVSSTTWDGVSGGQNYNEKRLSVGVKWRL